MKTINLTEILQQLIRVSRSIEIKQLLILKEYQDDLIFKIHFEQLNPKTKDDYIIYDAVTSTFINNYEYEKYLAIIS